MKIYEISFSPTGGTEKVAAILSNALGDEVIRVDLTDYKTDYSSVLLTKDDLAVIALPSYGGRVPAVAAERLTRVHGNGAGAVLVCVYGNRAYEDTLAELKDTAKKSGFSIIAAVAAIAEHSIARQFASGRPDEKDSQILFEFSEKIKEKISNGDNKEPDVPGNHPYKKAGGVRIIPRPAKNCVQCGICAEKCPVSAIDMDDAKKVNNNVCISCMRCISVCPHSARKISSIKLSAVEMALKKVCSERKECQLFL